MAHWNEVRDAWYVEQFRAFSDITKDPIGRYQETGDIADLAKLMDFLRLCDSNSAGRSKRWRTSG